MNIICITKCFRAEGRVLGCGQWRGAKTFRRQACTAMEHGHFMQKELQKQIALRYIQSKFS